MHCHDTAMGPSFWETLYITLPALRVYCMYVRAQYVADFSSFASLGTWRGKPPSLNCAIYLHMAGGAVFYMLPPACPGW